VSRARTHLWFDVAWPVLAGLVAGAGLLAAYHWTGPTRFLVMLAVLEVTVAPVAWSLLSELGFGVRRIALRVAPLTAVALVAVIGLAGAIGAWTYLVGTCAVATSPLLRGWSRVGLRGLVIGWSSTDVRTRREFDDIVAHGFAAPDDELPR
jgi:hypothetical protein